MNGKKYVAIDLGATTGRVVVGDLNELEVVHRFDSANELILGRYYWDMIKIFSEIKIGLKKAFLAYPEDIVSIGIDSWGVDHGLLDSKGELISPIYHYRDPRTRGLIEELEEKFGKGFLFNKTGIALQEYNSIYQLYALKKERPELFSIAKKYLSVPDLFAYWLTGKATNEISHASTTGLLDCETGTWSWEIIEKLGLPKEIFGTIIPSGTEIGELTSSIKVELGAPNGVKVIACATHDTASAIRAVPKQGEGQNAYISSGTWSMVGINLDTPDNSEEAGAKGFTNERGADNTITCVKNIMGMWIANECVRSWKEDGYIPDWKALDKETLENLNYDGFIDPNCDVFTLPGTKASPMPKRVEDYLVSNGFKAPTNKGQFLASIYKGLANIYSSSIKEVEKMSDKKIESINIVGGGSKNEILNQLTSDVTGLPVFAGPVEATALGNILTQLGPNSQVNAVDLKKYIPNK